MTYAEVMARTSSDFWIMLWPLYLLIAALAVGAFAKWITSK
jgi:hypothetical protein